MRNRRGSVLILLGLLLLAAALFLTGYNMYDAARAQHSVEEAVGQLDKMIPEEIMEEAGEPVSPEEVEYPDYVLNPEMEMPVQVIDGNEYIGVLSIPALGVELPVMSQWSYPGLKIAPGRYAGSAYLGNLVIAAHNYQSHFGGLKMLVEGDEITFTDVDGNVFRYQVVLSEVLNPKDVEEMESGDWDLTLFTCTVGGAYRVTVRCELVEEFERGIVAE